MTGSQWNDMRTRLSKPCPRGRPFDSGFFSFFHAFSFSKHILRPRFSWLCRERPHNGHHATEHSDFVHKPGFLFDSAKIHEIEASLLGFMKLRIFRIIMAVEKRCATWCDCSIAQACTCHLIFVFNFFPGIRDGWPWKCHALQAEPQKFNCTTQ